MTVNMTDAERESFVEYVRRHPAYSETVEHVFINAWRCSAESMRARCAELCRERAKMFRRLVGDTKMGIDKAETAEGLEEAIRALPLAVQP